MYLAILANEVGEGTTKLVELISIISLAVLAVALIVVCVANKKMNTKSLVYAAVCIATSFVLSFIKIAPVQYGGSITLASFVPVLIYAYAFGPVRGLIVGLIYGVLQFVQSPYILTPMTFVLDYLLAFATIGLMGFAKRFTNSTLANVILGSVLVYVARFVFHLISGIVYFNMDAVWVDLPMTNAFIYSFVYQCVYLPADAVIAVGVLALLVKQKAFTRLLNMMYASQVPVSTVEQTPASEAAAAEVPAKQPENKTRQ